MMECLIRVHAARRATRFGVLPRIPGVPMSRKMGASNDETSRCLRDLSIDPCADLWPAGKNANRAFGKGLIRSLRVGVESPRFRFSRQTAGFRRGSRRHG